MQRPASLRPYSWKLAPPAPAELAGKLPHLPAVMSQILYNRELTDEARIQAFLEGRYTETDDPFLLPDMEAAVARIEQAIECDERIVVYGDFDADGVTSTVLLVEALRGLGMRREQAQPYIPDRVDEGYGLNSAALRELREKGADLVISVDCGIRALHEVAVAREIGLDMIITDHHSLGRQLPDALAVINPKHPESAYPEKMLAGVGIAFKLAQALRRAMPQRARFEEEALLDLVALGTVADLAPLQAENRRLVIEGLEVINSGRRPGIAALAQVARLKPGSITAEHIGFGLGPRINAAGRLAHAYDAAKLLASNNMMMAGRYAQNLNALNYERRKLTKALSEQAEEQVRDDAPILIAAHPDFISGIVGLVASRLAEKHYRPAIVMEKGEEESRGSCRSIPEFHITEALDEVADVLERHGGHSQAAGFTVRNENLPAFEERLTEVAAARLDGLDLRPAIEIDAELDLQDIDWALLGYLEKLEPTGEANAPPVFVSRDVQVYSHRAVGDGSHLKLDVGDGRCKFGCIAFRQGAWAPILPKRVDVVYTLGVNEWNGRRDIQLVVKDIKETA
ncbi:MAG: single-stranded-DNA-specific exonuclease RecJ [Chloroflexota bacterium]